MLTTLKRLRPVRFVNGSSTTLRHSSYNQHDTTTSQEFQQQKRCFANDKMQEKVNREVKNSQERIFTLPNILTMSRIAVTPVMGYFIWNGMHSPALTCFAFAATTDLLDGFIARRFNQYSQVGAILDPIADKLLLTTCFIALYNTHLMPLWLVKVVVGRDLGILGFGAMIRYYGFGDDRPSFKKFMDFKNYPTLGFEPSMTSKINTALQCLVIVSILGSDYLSAWPLYTEVLFGLQCSTAFTTLLSASSYAARLRRRNWDATVKRWVKKFE